MKLQDILALLLSAVFGIIIAPFIGVWAMITLPFSSVASTWSRIKLRIRIRSVIAGFQSEVDDVRNTTDPLERKGKALDLNDKVQQAVLEELGVEGSAVEEE